MCHLGFGIFSEHFKIFDQRPDGFHCLMIAHEAVKSEINIEPVFPLAAYYRYRLYFGEIDIEKREYGQNFRQRSLCVGGGEYDRGFVGALPKYPPDTSFE